MAPSAPHRSLGRLLIGKPLATKELSEQAVSKVIGLAVFASDALSSTAYATEEILRVLALAGTATFNVSIPIALAIAVLLIILTLSYRQTIHAYPNGGGAYIVARDNLGELPAQIAGAALLTDYILTVAVSISSGVAQIASGIPALRNDRVEVALLVIFVITIINLRGVRESGNILAVPTYIFLVMAFLLIVMGGYQYFTGQLKPISGVQGIATDALEPLTWFLVLRAFSSGCTALTGVEAISNGITAFKEPKSKNAATTLSWMSTILIVIFLGFTWLAHQVQAVPSDSETIISQIARAVYGQGFFYILTLVGTALILLMAANTSYADFPRLAALHAGDGFLPHQLTIKGSRLVFSWGIIVLAILACLLIVFFKAQTSALIPLYAIGVFLSFTMSQTGMVVRTWKIGHMEPGKSIKTDVTTLEYDPAWKRRMVISATGALVTGIVMLVFVVTKFSQGAWFIVLLIPCLVFVFFRIHRHYRDVAQQLRTADSKLITKSGPVRSVLLVEDINIATLQMVNYARLVGCPWKAIHIAVDPSQVEALQQKWKEIVAEGEIIIIESPYRKLSEPLEAFLTSELAEMPDGYLNVILTHLTMDNVWEQALHQNSGLIFSLTLQNLARVVVTTVPFQMHHLTQKLSEKGGTPIPAPSTVHSGRE